MPTTLERVQLDPDMAIGFTSTVVRGLSSHFSRKTPMGRSIGRQHVRYDDKTLQLSASDDMGKILNIRYLIIASILLGASFFAQAESTFYSANIAISSNSDDKHRTTQSQFNKVEDEPQENYILESQNIPTDLKKFHTQPWNLLTIPQFKKLYLKALKGKIFTPWISKLFVVNSPKDNRACKTSDGVVFIYYGGKSNFAEDTIKIGFIPDKNVLGVRISDSVVTAQSGDYGDVTPLLDSIFNNQTCKEN